LYQGGTSGEIHLTRHFARTREIDIDILDARWQTKFVYDALLSSDDALILGEREQNVGGLAVIGDDDRPVIGRALGTS
jgi:hypothetical protein